MEDQEMTPGKWHQDVREECCECSVTVEDLLCMYEDEAVKSLFMCINHGADIVCFLCFHNWKNKKLFKCQCSTIEHWTLLPCGQPMLTHNKTHHPIADQPQINHDKASSSEEDERWSVFSLRHNEEVHSSQAKRVQKANEEAYVGKPSYNSSLWGGMLLWEVWEVVLYITNQGSRSLQLEALPEMWYVRGLWGLIHVNDEWTLVAMYSHNIASVDFVTRNLVDAAPFLIHNGQFDRRETLVCVCHRVIVPPVSSVGCWFTK